MYRIYQLSTFSSAWSIFHAVLSLHRLFLYFAYLFELYAIILYTDSKPEKGMYFTVYLVVIEGLKN